MKFPDHLLVHLDPELQRRSDLDDGRTTYAQDEAYLYGLAVSAAGEREPNSPPGFVLRAWPLEFGVSGDYEYMVTDAGPAWEGANIIGRSGTARAFPPSYPREPEPKKRSPWWPIELPAPDAAQR